MKLRLQELVAAGLLAALLYAQQVLLSGLPNIHLTALLVMLYAVCLPRLAMPAVAVFILLEGITYGFGIWWVSYLYIWPLLAAIAWCLRRCRPAAVWAVVGGAFGLCFGALCALPYLFAGGPSAALVYWVSGIPFDLLHGAGNFVLTLLLWNPLHRGLCEVRRRFLS